MILMLVDRFNNTTVHNNLIIHSASEEPYMVIVEMCGKTLFWFWYLYMPAILDLLWFNYDLMSNVISLLLLKLCWTSIGSP